MKEPAVFRVQIKLYGAFGEFAKRSLDEAELSQETTVYGLLSDLAKAYGESFRDELFDSVDKIKDDVMVTVNEAIIDRGNSDAISLEPGDVVALLPIFHGGG